jgi:anti-anti-sigma factor
MLEMRHMSIFNGKGAVVDIAGLLNSKNSSDFHDYIQSLLDNDIHYILINAQGLGGISSAGFGVLILLQRIIMARKGYFTFFNLPAEMKSIFSIIGFYTVLPFASTRIEAMEAMDKELENRAQAGSTESELIRKEILRAKEEPSRHSPSSVPKPKPIIRPKGQQVSTAQTTEEDDIDTITPEEPVIVECISCHSLVRVREAGDYLCPSCGTSFTLHVDKTVEF